MPVLVFDCKGIPATRRERIETAVEAGTSKSNTRDGLLPIHFVAECTCSSLAHKASSGRCCSLWTKILRSSENGFGRGSTRDGIVGSLRGTMRDKMRG
jgi:hypothetical protein